MRGSLPSYASVLEASSEAHLFEREPLLLLGATFAFLVVLLALIEIWKLRRNGAMSTGWGRFSSAVQDLKLKLDDFTGRFDTNVTDLQEEVQRLNDALLLLEQKVATLTPIVPQDILTDDRSDQARYPVSKGSTEIEPPPELTTEKKSKNLVPVIEQAPLAEISTALESVGHGSIATGLEKTRRSFWSRFATVFGRKAELGEEFYLELEELLISSDLGVKTSQSLVAQLRTKAKSAADVSEDAVRESLRSAILSILIDAKPAEIRPVKREGKPMILVVVGVNGVGKTTTIAKLAHHFRANGAKVLLGACDTFRAAAEAQLEHWAKSVGVEIVMGPDNAKPSTVAYQAVHKAQAEEFDVLIIDTAGRLHTRVNLMNELDHVIKIIEREQPGAPHETVLVLDASTGQNALQQAKEFHERTNLTGIIVTKLDGTPKGGIVVAIKSELGIPIRYVGVGEAAEDLKAFSAVEFVDGLLALTPNSGVPIISDSTSSPEGRTKIVRKRRTEGAETRLV